MKNITVLLGLFLAAGLAVAEQDQMKAKDAALSAEVVSVDASSKTITVRAKESPSSASVTLPVQGQATDALKDVKAGDTVSLTCRTESSKKASATSSTSSTSTPFAACAAVTQISKASGAAYSSTGPSTIADPFAAPDPMTAPVLGSNPPPSTSASILQGGTINPDQPSAGALSGTTSTTSATATDAKTRASQPAGTSATTATTTSRIDAVVVSADSSAKTITLRSAADAKSKATTTAQPSLTLPVEGQASAKLSDVKTGDRVTVTCRTATGTSSSSSAGADWAQASQCSMVTEIAKAKARTSDEPATSKTRSTTPELMEPGLVVPKK